ncbi:MAG: DUF4430 domain-containing protein [Candidatus Woesearchaeota archaeon]|nr:DUF4430 domain-containing protein [Candidatus Woesearchaeota archaeon]
MNKNLVFISIALIISLLSYGCIVAIPSGEVREIHEGKALLIVKTIGNTSESEILFNNVTAMKMLSQHHQVNITTHASYGAFISCIDSVCGEGGLFWAFYVNNKSSSVGAGSYMVNDGDSIEFRLTDKLD